MAEAAVTYEIALAQTFQASLEELQATHQAAVLEAIGKLQRGHGAVRLHALPPLPWVSFCVNRDAVRIICHREGSTLLLAWVALHDAAYRWAERHAPQRIGNVIRLVTVSVEGDVAAAPAPAASVAPPGPLAEVRDRIFRHFEVTPRLGAALRALADEDTLLDLCARLEPALAEALVSLATDPDGLAGIVARYGEARAGATGSLAEAVKAPVNAEHVWLAPPEQRAVEAALAAGAEAWRIFLHPSQKRLVTVQTRGPFLVTGGPGTGKTVVALHRARVLAERLGATPERPVLLTTFSRVLTQQLEEGVASVCRDAPELGRAVTTLTLTATARRVLEAARAPSALLLGEDLDAAWGEALALDVLGKGRRFYEREREEVVLAQELAGEEDYLKASRAGRGERLDRAAKRKVFAVLAAYEAALARRGGDDPGGLARAATRLLREGKVASPFAAVVCDEAQDASGFELRLLAALATAPGEEAPGADRLFLVGDGHQRLYQRPTSLRASGIEVRGRSARLRLNYRTTQGICAAALEALEGIPPDVIEEDAQEADRAAGYRSLRGGERPAQHVFATAAEEADFVAARLREWKERPVLVLARTRAMVASLEERLRARGVQTTHLGDADLVPGGDHVLVATLHRSKGLEAPKVILAGMQESPARFPGGSEEEKALWQQRERLLVYVGMTRARDLCVLTRVDAKATPAEAGPKPRRARASRRT